MFVFFGTLFAYKMVNAFFEEKKMDVKDLNNSAVSIQAMFTKAVAGQVAGAGFANFLKDGGEGLASVVGKKDDFVAVKDVKANNKEQDARPVEAKPVENKVVETENKSVAKKDKTDKKSDNKEVSGGERTAKTEVKENEVNEENAVVAVNDKNVENSDVQKPDNENEAIADVSDVAPVTEKVLAQDVAPLPLEVSPEAIVALQNEVVAVFTENGDIVVAAENTDLVQLSETSEVPVFDEVTGQTIQVSGKVVAQNIQTAGQNEALFVLHEVESAELVSVVPAKIEETADRDFNFAKIENMNSTDGDQVLLAQEVVEQAKILDTKIGEDKKVKISVDVNEENFSYTDEVNLVQDKVVLDEVVKSVLSEKTTEAKNSQFGIQANNQMQAPQGISSLAGNTLSAVAAGTTNAVIQNGAEVAKTASVEAISSVTNTSGQIMSSVAVAGAEHKAESVTKAFEPSSKDVYKGLSKEAVEQVKVNITKSAVKGVDKIDIQLKPQELGTVEVKMQISKDGKLQAHIISSKAETMEVLQREVQDLERAFNEAGFETDSGSFSFSFRGDESGNEKDRNAELRSFIGNVLEQDSEDVRAENDNLQDWNPSRGLNIRV